MTLDARARRAAYALLLCPVSSDVSSRTTVENGVLEIFFLGVGSSFLTDMYSTIGKVTETALRAADGVPTRGVATGRAGASCSLHL